MNVKLFRFTKLEDFSNEAKNQTNPTDTIVFVIEPKKETVDRVMNFYYKLITCVKNFAFLFMPEISYEIKNFLKNYQFDIRIFSFSNEAYPIDKDLITLHLPNCFRELYVENDTNCLSTMARVLAKLEMLFGIIKYKFVKGDNSRKVKELLENEEQINSINDKTQSGEIFSCIIMERSCDPIAPFCSQYTYEGYIDEFFGIHWGINSGHLYVPSSLVPSDRKSAQKSSSTSKKSDMGKFEISLDNEFYEQSRCMPVFPLAINFIRMMKENYDKKAANAKKGKELDVINKNLEEFANAKKKENPFILAHFPLITHIAELRHNDHITQETMKFEQLLLIGENIENLHEFYVNQIAKKADLVTVLRLMCIESLTKGGIRNYTALKKDIILTYGFQYIFLFNNLEKAGLLKEEKGKGNPVMNLNYPNIYNKMELLNTEFDYSDCSYLGVGYNYIGVKMIESAVDGNWKKIEDGLDKIPGYQEFPRSPDEVKNNKKEKNIIFAVFIGGVTYAEIEGIRFLNKQRKDTKIIIVTTNIIGYKNLIKSFDTGETNATFSFRNCYKEISEEENKIRGKK